MDLRSKIRDIPDFPKPGVRFRDITTLLRDGPAWRHAIKSIADVYRDRGVEMVVGPEARGFLVGATVAYELRVGFVPVRRPGKLPARTLRGEYVLEYGQDALEIHLDALEGCSKVLVVDDLLATGGTIKATLDLVRQLGVGVVGVAFLIELTYLGGRENLKDYEVTALVRF
ncbi:MAG: adenine phosphoribosyltransferase [bacterium]|nr:adenine phosphoribosyltransferase [bacterium]